MSLDRSLRSQSTLARHRNVLSRAERLARLKDEESWDESQSAFGLPKVANRKTKAAKKKAKSEEPAESEADSDEAPAT